MSMKTAAIQIHDLVRSLGITKARVVEHDIVLMVAYAYAAQFPPMEKLFVMETFLPGVQGWEPIYNDPDYWRTVTASDVPTLRTPTEMKPPTFR